MTGVIDHEMESVARQLWPSPQRLELATGGLFNRVVRVESSVGTHYLKRFTDAASSGDFPPLPTNASQRCLVATSWHDLAIRASAREPGVAVPALLAVHTELDLVAMSQAHGEALYDALVVDGGGGRGEGSGPRTGSVLQAVMAWLGALHSLPLEPRSMLMDASGPFKAFKVDLQYTRVLTELPHGLQDAGERFVADYLQRSDEPVHGDLNSRNILSLGGEVSVIDFEQGHWGEGVYDVAYLLSEYVIRTLRAAADPEPMIERTWACYGRSPSGHVRELALAALPCTSGFSDPVPPGRAQSPRLDRPPGR